MERPEIRRHLVEALTADLVGPMEQGEILPARPSRWYLTGFLVPRGAPPEQRFDPTAAEELDAGVDGDADDDRGDEPAATTRPFLPSSFGLSVLVPASCRALTVEASWGEYAKIDEEHARAVLGDRLGPLPEERDDEDDEDEPVRKRRYWQRTPVVRPAVTLSLGRSGPIEVAPGVRVTASVRTAVAPGLPAGTRAVAVFLVNEREPAARGTADERSLFQVRMEIGCDDGFVPRVQRESGAHEDDRRNDVQYRDHREWAVGHGVSSAADPEDAATCNRVATTWVPVAAVRRVVAASVEGVPTDMERLAALPLDELQRGLRAMLTAYGGWIDAMAARGRGLDDRRRDTTAELTSRAEAARVRIERSIGLLGEDADALTAFRLTNTAMAMAARRARPQDYMTAGPAWRPFQLAFVLLNLRSVADADDPDRETVDLLFFPTGGGKTEAYLGIAAYAMLLRRLRAREERHRGAGLTVLLRYTLRLLTLDQLGRAAALTCALELLRRTRPELGDRRFAVGLWVGRKATANTLDDALKQVNAFHLRPNDARLAPPVPLVGCPWCGSSFEAGSFDVPKENKRPVALRVGCANVDCDFAFRVDPQGLPIVVVDEQLYRELPALVIATVDKFAALPWRGATGALFGKVQACDARGFYGLAENPPKGADTLPHGVPPPALIIQDELHLITGPLGTMVGLYETAIDLLGRDGKGRPPKIVASTATVRRAGDQIRALFGRTKVALFPPQGPDEGDTFFARTDSDLDAARLYVGVAAPGRSVKAITARVYAALLSASYRTWFGRPADLENPADTYMSLVCYFNSLRELGGAQRLILEEVAPLVAKRDRHRPLGQERSAWFASRHLGFDLLELTSRQDTGAIREAKGKLEGCYSPKDGRRTDVLLASSMISVGVDIPRLGLMVVNGQPRTVAEYIQATSRVGRRTPGLVVTLFNSFKPRDRSHYERFTAFHHGFYRYVEASSVTPFSARALERGLPGLTVALARHRRGLAGPKDVEFIRKAKDVPDAVAKAIADRGRNHREGAPAELGEQVTKRIRGLFADWRELADVMARSSAPMAYSSWEGVKGARSLLSSPVDPPSEIHPHFDHFRAPTSMRDVEPGVHVWVRRFVGGGDE